MVSATPSEILTLKEAAEMLGVTAVRVRQLVIAGKITSKNKTFLRKDVDALKAERAGQAPRTYVATRTEAQIAIRAFGMFKEGRSILDVMIALELTPQRVRILFKEFQTPLGKRAPMTEEEREKEDKAFADDFDREQAERRKRNLRETEERNRAMAETLERITDRRKKRR